MLAEADTTPLTTRTFSSAPLHACRFCGETEKLEVGEGDSPDQYLFDTDLKLVRTESGEPYDFTDANVWCQVCDAMAPRQVWNATAEANAVMRAVTLAAWVEYSAEDGSWIGARQ